MPPAGGVAPGRAELGDDIPVSLADGSRLGEVSGDAEGEPETEAETEGDDDGAADGADCSSPPDPQLLTASTVPSATAESVMFFHNGMVRPDTCFRGAGLLPDGKLLSEDEAFLNDDIFHDRLFIGSLSTYLRYIVNYAPQEAE